METTQRRHIGFWKSVGRKAILTVAIVCGFSNITWSQPEGVGGRRGIDVATVNLYIGASFTPVTTLDPSDPNFGMKLLSGVATIYGNIVASNFPKRAEALAQELVARAPDLIALQEVPLIRRQMPGDAIIGGTVPATAVEADYLAILLEALQRNGAHYEPACQVQNIDVEVPLLTPGGFHDLRLTDRDVILKRTDLPAGYLRTSNPQRGNFAAFVPLPIGVNVLRGWCSVDVQVRGRSFRVINTHLEEALPSPLPDIQGFQAAELLLGPANTTLPVILAGDFNSDAHGNYGPTVYPLLTGIGEFTDAWSVARPGELGLTWGHDELLADPRVPFTLRLDLLLYRGSIFNATSASTFDPVIGTSRPLWFSDHAGLITALTIQ